MCRPASLPLPRETRYRGTFTRSSADHYFVLEGTLTIVTRPPEETRTIAIGGDYRIVRGTEHLISNRSAADCRFLLLQGVGQYDWVKAGD
jgi:hypothetical protein